MVTRSFDRETEYFLLQRLEARVKYSMQKRSDRIKSWELAEDKALAYLHEQDEDALRRASRELKGQTTYTTLQIPYSYATLMTAHTYMTSVFFSRAPVHQFSGRHGETEQQAPTHGRGCFTESMRCARPNAPPGGTSILLRRTVTPPG